jgi:DNA/RNA endonuclease YhcR with UshA esterase domain
LGLHNRSKFSTPPEAVYSGKTVRATGKIETYNGSCEIIVSSPEQIEVVQ